MKRIGLDGRALESNFKAHASRGTGRYVQEVLKQLLDYSDEEFNFGLFRSADLQLSDGQEGILEKLPYGRRTVENQLFSPAKLNKLPFDVLHFFSHCDAPAWFVKPYMLTVLDLIPLKFPEMYRAQKPSWRFNMARWLENKAAKHAQGIFTISESTARDLVEILDYPPQKVQVTYLAVDEQFRPLASTVEERRFKQGQLKRQLGYAELESMLLYVGGIDPRKNVSFLIELFAAFLQTHRGACNPKLVIVGRIEADDQYPLLLAKIKECQVEESVKLVGYVPDEQLYAYYQAADVFIFPSLYEGFGLPVLEAMACGTPVLAGNNSSLPEVMGPESLRLNDNDLAEWHKALSATIEKVEMHAHLSEIGLRQAQQFSWEKTADSMITGYKRFLCE
ncbi:MAG: glycosyltransferase family 4 protein [Deltaproteobacteria bacterium]|nr:glycosyltransferase family 4 protein [Deltaproteobacteria bacterium]